MASRLYLHVVGEPGTTPQASRFAPVGSLPARKDGGGNIGAWALFAARTVRDSDGATNSNTASVNGATSGIDEQPGGSSFPFKAYISPPIDADVTISGTITLNLWALESGMNANAAINARIWRLNAATGDLTLIATTARVTEVGTSSSVNNFTVTPTSTAFTKGDRIVIGIFWDDAGTMATGFTLSFVGSGTTAAASGDSYVEFNETFGYIESDPGGTTVYFTDTAASGSINPGSATEKEAWTSRGGAAVSAITNTVAGPTSPVQVTATAGGTALEWYTRPLQAVTLGGAVLVNLRGMESGGGNALVTHGVEIAVVDNDGTNPVVWAIGTESHHYISTTEALINQWYVSGDDLSVSAGQRLRIRVFIDDGTDSGGMQSGFTATFRYGGTSGGATGDSWLKFTQTLTESTGSTVSGSFTANAVLKKTISGSLTANAVLKRSNQPGSFTADAVLKRAMSGSLTADSWIRRNQTGSLTADAVLKRSNQPGSFTADAVLKRSNQPGSFTADAYFMRVVTGTLTIDAVLKRTISSSITANAVLRATASGSLIANAIVKRTMASVVDVQQSLVDQFAAFVGHTSFGALAAQAFVPSVSGLLEFVQWSAARTGSVADNLVLELQSDAAGLPSGSVLATIETVTGSTLSTSRVVRVVRVTSGVQLVSGTRYWLVFRRSGSLSSSNYYTVGFDVSNNYPDGYPAFSTDGSTWSPSGGDEHYFRAIVATPFSVTANAVLKRTMAGSFTADAVIRRTYEAIFDPEVFDPAVFATGISARAIVRREQGGSFTANAYILGVGTVFTFPADAVIRCTQLAALTADAIMGRTQAGSVTADTVVRRPQAGSITADAALRRVIPASLTGDAVLKRTQSHTVLAEALVRAARSATLTADAVRRASLTGTLTAEAVVRKTGTASFTANAVILAPRMAGFGADAVFLSPRSQSLTADAIVRRAQSGAIAGDAVLRTPRASSLSADATVRRSQTATLTAAAIVRETVQGTLAASAVTRRTETRAVSADAYIVAPGSGLQTFTADAVVRRSYAQTVTADAVKRVAISGQVLADAYLRAVRTSTFTANAVLRATRSGSLTAAAVVRVSRSGSITASAFIRASSSGSLTADAVLRATRSNLVSADAVLRATRPETMTADAVVRGTSVNGFTADAFIVGGAHDLTADAVIRRTQTGGFTADAMISTGDYPSTFSILSIESISSVIEIEEIVEIISVLSIEEAAGVVEAQSPVEDITSTLATEVISAELSA